MNLFNKKHRNKKFLFSDLKPGERIYKVIETYIYPDLEKIGFKMSKSNLSLTKKVGDFKQEIYFAKNKYNSGNEVVSFDPFFSVTSRYYVRWHKKEYGTEPLNDSILGTRAHYVPNWNHDYFGDWWYDLAKDDNEKIVNALKLNIEENGLPYLNIASDKRNAIEFIMSNEMYYKAPMLFDFATMLNDKSLSEKIINWFLAYKENSETNFQESTLNDIEIREKIIKNWAHTKAICNAGLSG